MYRKNTAGQFVCVQLVLAASGAAATGLSPAARRCIDGTFAAGGGSFTEDGSTGSYKYALAQADTNGNDISIIVTATGAIPVAINFVTTAADPTDSVRLGLTALPNAAAEATGGLYTRGNGAGQITQDANGRIDANAKAWAGTATTLSSGVPDTNVKTITSGIIAAASFASGALDAVWSTATRLLTAGTNIVLAKGVGVTGFTDLDAAGVRTAVGLASANLDTQLAAVGGNIKKNTAQSGFMFVMTDSTTHAPKTGVTVSATRSLDGAAFSSCANAVSEIGNGWYKINLDATDTNGNHVALRFTGTSADDLNIELITQP
jgi:hypothetical protein